METKKVLITGSAGFMGSWIADTLVEKGEEVFGIDNLSGGKRENYSGDYEMFKIDLAVASQVERVIKKVKPEIIFHLASCAREGASQFQPLYVSQTNYQAFMNIIEPAIKYGLDKLIFTSSMAVYGNQKPPNSEDMPRLPTDIYGVNKAAIERSIEILAEVHSFDYVILRPHNVMGPRQNLTDHYRNVVTIFMNRIMRNEPLYIYGDGKLVRAFSYIEDSLPCYVRCLDDNIKNEIINIGGMKPITINKLADLVCEAMNAPKDYPREYLPLRPREVRESWCTWQKSVEILGYEENVGYEEGIRRTAEWAKKKGPQEWTDEKMPLQNDRMPRIWR